VKRSRACFLPRLGDIVTSSARRSVRTATAGVVVLLITALQLVVIPVLVGTPAASALTNSATHTAGINPDTYAGCTQSAYFDFEGLPDGTNLSAAAVNGVQFTTTGGYTWLVGDFSTGSYNGKYPAGAYTSQGTHWAWLGTVAGHVG
jgi:hypothetical protein